MLSYLLLGALAVSFGFYLYSLFRCRLRTRVISKATTSLLFVFIAMVSRWLSGADQAYFGYIIVALCLCAFGDVFLEIAWEDELGINYFVFSLAAFFVAHIFFLVLFWHLSGLHPADLVATALIVSAWALAARKLRFDFLNMGGYVLTYAAVMTLMCVKSMSLLYGAHVYSPRNILVAVGAALFFLSSVLSSFGMFRRRYRSLAAVSAGVYYVGQSLIALSVLFA